MAGFQRASFVVEGGSSPSEPVISVFRPSASTVNDCACMQTPVARLEVGN